LRNQLTVPRLSILTFAAAIAVGTVLLLMPFANAGPTISFIDALFTSTSAVCVTGLSTFDVGKQFTQAGQLVLLALIQAGGLGIMTISTVMMVATKNRLGLGGRSMMNQVFVPQSESINLKSVLFAIFRYTALMELGGAVLLYLRFRQEFAPLKAVYFSLFHAISAFCNAGFSLYANSLENYAADPLINLVIAFLVIGGGLGFFVASEIYEVLLGWIKTGKKRKITLHTKIVVMTTLGLLLCGTVAIGIIEWHGALGRFSAGEKVLVAFFQSVTPRSSGFSTLPMPMLSLQTLFLMIILMFIGASSGSCGGGIKTGTFAALLLWGKAHILNQKQPVVWKRSLSQASYERALNTLAISVIVIIAATFLLVGSEGGSRAFADRQVDFISLLFEVVSAFGTVGLSLGITASLSAGGKLIIIMTMFIGRLGPLAIGAALSKQKQCHYSYAEENIMIG
jgi:trk system potassium uptake protein TrkH